MNAGGINGWWLLQKQNKNFMKLTVYPKKLLIFSVNGDWIYGGITWNLSKKEVFIHTEWDEGKVIPETVGQYVCKLCDFANRKGGKQWLSI